MNNKKRTAQTRTPEYLPQLRHSCAHVLAQAVQELFPGTKIAIGPAIDNGFYYDFDGPHHFTLEDLPRIEARMLEIAKGDHPFKRQDIAHGESRAYWKERNEPYKVEILDDLGPVAQVSHYSHDTFTDLCRGNHLESTADVRHFKLTHVSGAYWRGDEKRPMLQRIYGTAWGTAEELKAHLDRMEEAKRRDHRKLGQELKLFSVHEEAGAGLVHWHPKGAAVRYQIESYIRGLLNEDDYQFVYTPHIASEKLYAISGHLENYAENMYGAMDIEGQAFRAKPMNCPNHILVYKSDLHSYRELPVRIAEFGTVYRFERSGVLHGLLRVRGFTQDDAHIFCTAPQIRGEIERLLVLADRVYKDFGFEKTKVFLSTRPEKFTGAPELWDEAEAALKGALDARAGGYELDAGGGAFYGPKIDLKVEDALGREWQLCTVQLDFNLPRRFEAVYRNNEGKDQHVVMIHRALIGSFERFMGVLIEHYAGKFPFWLAPTQVKVLNLTDAQIPYAQEVLAALKKAGLRVDSDLRPEKLGAKIREATLEKVPYIAVVGAQEAAARTVSLRLRSGKSVNGLPLDGTVEKLKAEAEARGLTSVFEAAESASPAVKI